MASSIEKIAGHLQVVKENLALQGNDLRLVDTLIARLKERPLQSYSQIIGPCDITFLNNIFLGCHSELSKRIKAINTLTENQKDLLLNAKSNEEIKKDHPLALLKLSEKGKKLAEKFNALQNAKTSISNMQNSNSYILKQYAVKALKEALPQDPISEEANSLIEQLKQSRKTPTIADERNILDRLFVICHNDFSKKIDCINDVSALTPDKKESIKNLSPDAATSLGLLGEADREAQNNLTTLLGLKESIELLEGTEALSEDIEKINAIIADDQNTIDRKNLDGILHAIHQGLLANDYLQVLENFYLLDQYLQKTLFKAVYDRQPEPEGGLDKELLAVEQRANVFSDTCGAWFTNIQLTTSQQKTITQILGDAIELIRGKQAADLEKSPEEKINNEKLAIINGMNTGLTCYCALQKNNATQNVDTEHASQGEKNSSEDIDIQHLSSSLAKNLEGLAPYLNYLTLTCNTNNISPATKINLIDELFKKNSLQAVNAEIPALFSDMQNSEQKTQFEHRFRRDVFEYEIKNVNKIIAQEKERPQAGEDKQKTVNAQRAFVQQIMGLIQNTDWKVSAYGGKNITTPDKKSIKVPYHVAKIFKKCQILSEKNISEEEWLKEFNGIVKVGKDAAEKLPFFGKRDTSTQEFYEDFKHYSPGKISILPEA